MTDAPPGRNKDNAPEIVLRDTNLRSATWITEGEYGPMFNTRITKLYRDEDGNPQETATMGSKDLLRVSELARETHYKILARQRKHAQERKAEREDNQPELSEDWHDDDKRRDEIKRERFKDERKPVRGTRRAKPRDRAAR